MKYLVFTLSLIFSHFASASFIQTCDFGAEVLEVGTLNGPSKDLPHYNREMIVNVITAKTIPGSHTSCDSFVGTELTLVVNSPAALLIANTGLGHYLHLGYFHYNGLTPNGVYSETKTTLIAPETTAFKGVLNDEEVRKAISLTKVILGENVSALVSGQVQTLQGICGFAGCEDSYIVTLTYGDDFMNAPRITIVAKTHVDAFGQVQYVRILDQPEVSAQE